MIGQSNYDDVRSGDGNRLMLQGLNCAEVDLVHHSNIVIAVFVSDGTDKNKVLKVESVKMIRNIQPACLHILYF